MAVPSATTHYPAVVTGASQGIGKALATHLAARGYELILVARREDLLDQLAAELTQRYGVGVEVCATDLADPDDRHRLCAHLAACQISILCANAGTATFGPLALLDPEQEKAQVQLNVSGVYELILAVLPGMLERRQGGILISGSLAGNAPIPNNATYAATKAFVNTFSEALHAELSPQGIHVTLLAPGPVRAQMPDQHEASLVDRLIPDYLWVSTDYTAQLALDHLDRNSVRVIPGVVAHLMSVATRIVPRPILTPILGMIYRKLAGQ